MAKLLRIALCLTLVWSAAAPLFAAGLGPTEPKVLWVYKSAEQFVAAPTVGTKQLFVSTIGAFNTGAVRALALDPKADAKARVVWTISAPYLKLPTVSKPALAAGKLVFGDAMHQNDGGTLHCVEAETGLALWEYVLPGTLVHLEGHPAIVGDRVYMGGGNAGVFCVELNRVTLKGKDADAKTVAAELDKQWKILLAKYEADKKVDPDFAVPPNRDELPKAMPKLNWKVGTDKWHVDAAVAVAGEHVFAATAFLDKEKQGERALLCLNEKDGSVVWKTPLKLNPWAGPLVAGKRVLVGGSTVRLDPEALHGAKGEIVAMNEANGQIAWHKELPGGVVSTAAATDKVAVFTATDGKVRCVSLADGNDAWAYDCGAPLFAGATIAGDTVYVGDLKGVVHAIALADGKQLWTLDLHADPAHIGGSIYGTAVVQDGRLYVGTCSVGEGEPERRPNAIVCIGK
ncbi:MAG TPA: PQQ-binding-like beta-propeller repeat protein [Pirellulales bacterium]|jgi:outer membrane protein assembly factor BamB|nr:PQQ-binding-like beta-propeller repeat protein [Pirellulales bacterium]